jgi:hypothetical protein
MRLSRLARRKDFVVARPTDIASAGVLGGPGVKGVVVVSVLTVSGEGQTVDAVVGLSEEGGRERDKASRFGLGRLRCITGGRVGGDEVRDELLERVERGELEGDGIMSGETILVGVVSSSR